MSQAAAKLSLASGVKEDRCVFKSMNSITPSDVIQCQHLLMYDGALNVWVDKKTRQPDPDTASRRQRFRDVCIARGWRNSNGTWRVVDIAEATGRQPNQVNNLLSDNSPFGQQVARSLEDELQLPRFHLDGAAEWPFSRPLQDAVEKLTSVDLWHAENALRAHLKINPLTVHIGNRKRA